MAYVRMINTNFWKDTYVIDLDPTEKLLFLYLLTNPRTTIAGIYEISLREMAFDTGIDRDMVQKILDRFIRDEKIIFKKNWIAMQNWLKHQAKNPKVEAGIFRILENDVPKWLIDEIITTNNGGQLDLLSEPMDSLSKPITLNLTKLNLTKLNLTADKQPLELTEKQKKRQYALAAQADRDQEARVQESSNRNGSTKSLKEMYSNYKLTKGDQS